MQGCSHVAHVASPLPGNWVKKPDDLIVPARDGVLRALRAARAAGVRRFVMTSSVAAIVYGRGRGVHHFSEADWTPSDFAGISPYTLSKTLAERAARDWVAREGGGIEFCSVNPAVVLGPVWGADYSSSIALVKKLLTGSMPGCPDLGFGVVDVRDVADLHVRALVAPGHGRRALHRLGPVPEGDRDRAHPAPAAGRSGAARAHAPAARPAGARGRAVRPAGAHGGQRARRRAPHRPAAMRREVLGWVARPPEQTIVDTARSLIEHGLVRV